MLRILAFKRDHFNWVHSAECSPLAERLLSMVQENHIVRA